MIPALTVIDDFLPVDRAIEIRKGAIDAGFEDLKFMGGTYQGSGITYRPTDMAQAIANFFGGPIEIHVSAFRSGHKDTTLHVNIHSDNSICAWAGVYYLNLPEQCKGGTAFYTLKETGWDTMPTQERLDASGHDLDWMKSKWTDESQWTLNSVAGMKFNRFIFYPTQYFHSRYPLQGWGEKSEDARLVWVCFFNILPSPVINDSPA